MPASESDLARLALFQDMTADERQQVLELVSFSEHSAAETILEEGKSTQALWVLLRGRCHVLKHSQHGTEQELAVLEPGSVFGEMSFFHPAPHSATVKAVTAVEVMRLPRAKYEPLEVSGSRAAYKLVRNTLKVLSERLRKMDEWICREMDGDETGPRREEWHEFRKKLYSEWDF